MAREWHEIEADVDRLLIARLPPQDYDAIAAVTERCDYIDLCALLGAVLDRYADLMAETHKLPAGLRRRPPGE
jgi:hypothetical protein